jgi:lysophospholipase L1-like esterase
MPRPRALLGNLALALGVLGGSLALLEGGARFLERSRPRPAEGEIWSWRQWPDQFYTLRTDASLWPAQRRFNAEGLRDRGRPEAKPPGVVRVAALGDSVTFGDGIAPRQAYPQVLESLLAARGLPIEVMNVALPGWSTRQQRLAYERIVRRYEVDLVLLGVCLNDVTELFHNLRPPPAWLVGLHRRSALVRRVLDAQGQEVRSVEELFRDDARARLKVDLFLAELRDLAASVRADRTRLVVLVFPFAFQLQPDAPSPVVQRRIREGCAQAGLHCVDTLPWLAPLGSAAFRDHDHFTPEGAALLAERLAASGLLPARAAPEEILSGAGQSAAEPRKALGHARAEVRASAVRLLGRSTSAVDALARGLADPSAEVRHEAARGLAGLGEAARPAARALFAALADAVPGVRWQAAQALHAALPPLPEALPGLARAAGSPDRFVREFAAATLGAAGPAAAAAVPDLVEALGREGAFNEAGPAAALGRIGPAAAPAVPALRRGLSDPDPENRFRAARALAGIGPAARAAEPDLRRLLSDPDDRVRRQAARALAVLR